MLKDGEIGIERKAVGADTAYLLKVGDGVTAYADLPYLQAVAADVYAWAKNQNLIEGVLATYTRDMTKTGAITASDTLAVALSRIENAIASAMEGNGEENQNAFTVIKVGDTDIVADSKTDTLELAAGENITLTPDAASDKVTIEANHPPVTMGSNTTSTATPAHGGTFDVIDAVTKDANGHVTAVNTKTVTLPTVEAGTKVGYTADATEITVTATPQAGDVLLGDAAAKTVASAIPPVPTTAQNAQLPTLEAVKTYADNLLAANDAMVFKGTIGDGGTVTALPAAHEAGWTYRVVTAGTYAGHACEVGDLIICVTKGSTANNSHWTAAQTNIDGAVTAAANLDSNALVVGGGTKNVKTLANGAEGQVLKFTGGAPAWGSDNDTKVADIPNDTGKVFTGLTGNTTLTQTNVGALKLTGFTQDATPTGAVAAADTLSDALNKLENAIDAKPEGTVTSVGITGGSGLTVSGSPVTTSGNIAVGIDNAVPAQTSQGLYTIAHNAQGLITASAAVTSISTDLLANGVETLVFFGGTSSTVI